MEELNWPEKTFDPKRTTPIYRGVTPVGFRAPLTRRDLTRETGTTSRPDPLAGWDMRDPRKALNICPACSHRFVSQVGLDSGDA